MIDYFALLDQPTRPWLDPEKLKDSYHQKTLKAHPDTQTSRPGPDATSTPFASLNEAYQVLQDPKRRLHHLLNLKGAAPSSTDQTVPSPLHDLFPAVGMLSQRANHLQEEIQAASNALSRSLLKPQILEVQSQAREVRARIQELFDVSLAELRRIDAAWGTNPTEQIEALSNLYSAFAYLTRWSAQVDELMFQLSLH